MPVEVAPHRRVVVPLAIVAAAWAVWASGPGAATPAYLVVAVAGAALGVVDARSHRLPDAITWPAVVIVAVLLAAAGVVSGETSQIARAVLGALALGSAYLGLHLINPSGLGFGDVKLALLLGLPAGWAGWGTVWWTGAAPFLLGGVAGLVLVVARRAGRKSAIAFGP